MSALKPGTPLPWEVLSWANPYESHDHRQVKIVRYAEDGGKSWVAECSGGSFYYHEGTEANAAYIVQACNAYPTLFGLVERIVREWDESDMDLPSLVEDCRAALKKARSEA